MKQKFSTKWKGSRKIRKQRKYRINAPLHLKHKALGAHLSKELRKKYAKRSVALRKGDTIKVMRGKFKKKQGKISAVNVKKGIVYVEGLQKTRKDGTKVNVPFKTSNLMIITLDIEDKKRQRVFDRIRKTTKKVEREKGK